MIRKLRRRRPPPERELASSELIPFYSVADAQRYALDQALAPEPRGPGARHQPDSAAVIASLFAANALAWCRFLNAFPESDFAVPPGRHRGWIQVGDDQFLYTDGTGCGRSGRALPPDVDPASVPRVSLDTSAAPGGDALQAGIDRVRRELARGWAVDDADEVVRIAPGVLDREATLRAYGERYKSLCEAAARWVLEGITAERRHLDDATLADRMVRADAMMEALALDAEQAYAEFRTDGPTCAHAYLAREMWFLVRAAAGGHGPLNALGHALIAGAEAEDPAATARTVSRGLIVMGQAYYLMSEDVLDALLSSIDGATDERRSRALGISPPDHRSYFSALYLTAVPIRALLELELYLDVIHEIREDACSDGFWQRLERARKLADEQRVRVSEALRSDAEDLLGNGVKTARGVIRDVRARDGEPAARLAALERTIHSFQYPRSVEPYLLGEVDAISWKKTLPS